MAKHTRGPWKIDARKYAEYAMYHISCGQYIVAHALGEMPSCEVEAEGNARLIAAAPETAAERDRLKEVNADLLAALKDMVTACECASSPKCDHCSKSRAAIAKAEEKTVRNRRDRAVEALRKALAEDVGA